MKIVKWKLALLAGCTLALQPASAQTGDAPQDEMNVNAFVDALTNPNLPNRNSPQEEEWLQDNGFGIFITWSVDSQLGTVISHSLVGASDDYTERYFTELPKTFNPTKFDPDGLARLIRISGARYAVFTAKHHAGFAMWDSSTTEFSVMNTPYKRDIVKQYVDAVRAQGLGIGIYYSPEDFHWAHSKGISDFDRLTVVRDYSPFRADFEKLVKAQITELFTNYGPIDVFFNDGQVFGTTNDYVWDLQPNTLITRSVIPTPEQTVPSVGYNRAWESIITMTDQWNYKPSNVAKKSAGRVLESLIETRAKGGALLINVGIKPDGSVDDYELGMLTTLGAWNFINNEAIFDVRPWVITHEGNKWFTRKKDSSALYVILQGEKDWDLGERRQFLLRSVRAAADTKISILGASGTVVEYRPDLTGKAQPTFRQGPDGLHIDVMRTQRIYNNYQWPYPLVVKLENVSPSLAPAIASTLAPEFGPENLVMKGQLNDLGDQSAVDVAFEYRDYKGFIDDYVESREDVNWTRSKTIRLNEPGPFTLELKRPAAGQAMVYRVVTLHPTGVVIEGNEARIDETGTVSMP